MDQNKYFTPSIEDIRVGYECEVNSGILPGFREGWTNEVLNQENTAYYLKFGSVKSMFRVPYLTKEQIEKEGWEFIWAHPGELQFRKNGNQIAFNFLKYTLLIQIGSDDSFSYKGECKDINTFRYICKLLGINE
jgi:hypothetical protein